MMLPIFADLYLCLAGGHETLSTAAELRVPWRLGPFASRIFRFADFGFRAVGLWGFFWGLRGSLTEP